MFVLLVLVCLTAIAAVILKKRNSKAYKCTHINFLNKLRIMSNLIKTTGINTNSNEAVLLDSLTNKPGTQNAAYGLVVDGVSTLEMNVAYGVVMEKNEAYDAPTDGIHNSVMRPNIAYNTGAITTHEDSGGYVIIQGPDSSSQIVEWIKVTTAHL